MNSCAVTDGRIKYIKQKEDETIKKKEHTETTNGKSVTVECRQ
jgi:hypothetical protein